jgi:hypothetical protein
MPDTKRAALDGFGQAITAALAEDLSDDELREALETRLRQEAVNRTRSEAERLRAAGFVLEAELNGRPLWTHPKAGANYWHEEALATLRGDGGA